MNKPRIAAVLGVLTLLLSPAVAAAQGVVAGAIAGVVKDTTGAVLPGATVEAASPVLIEKVQGGIISGKVTADNGPVRAVRVKARDTVRKIAYTVFTSKGSYQIFNLPAGTYEVSALQEGLESTIQTVELKAGENRSAALALTAKPPARKMELVDYESLYPPARGRDVFMKECGGCHGLEHIPLHRRGPRSEEAWRSGVNRMFEVNRSLVPVVSPDAVSAADRELIVEYLNNSFGADTTPRDLKLDEVVLDEAELAQAVYVEYDLPPVEQRPDGREGQRGTHDVFPSQASPNVWMVDTGQSSILGMRTDNLDYPARFREWRVPTAGNAHPHGLIEAKGKVYWSELAAGPSVNWIRRPAPSTDTPHPRRARSIRSAPIRAGTSGTRPSTGQAG